MQKMTYLLTHRHHVQIFPEGTRSKSGRINQEKFTRGAGQLLRKAPDTRVLCVYLRGHSQKASSDFPPQGENFFCALKSIAPQTVYTGLQADRDLTAQIMQTLAQMEQAYFSQSAFV
jgi:1-acyl-sn-glycerol-3-phosphate acyltransferase